MGSACSTSSSAALPVTRKKAAMEPSEYFVFSVSTSRGTSCVIEHGDFSARHAQPIQRQIESCRSNAVCESDHTSLPGHRRGVPVRTF